MMIIPDGGCLVLYAAPTRGHPHPTLSRQRPARLGKMGKVFFSTLRRIAVWQDMRVAENIEERHQNCRFPALKTPLRSMRLSYAANISRFSTCHWAVRAAFAAVSMAISTVAERLLPRASALALRLTGRFGLRFKMCSIWTNSRCAGTGRVSSNQSHHRIRRWIFCVIPGRAQPRPGNEANAERTILGRGNDRRQHGPLYRLSAAHCGELISGAGLRAGEKSQHAGTKPRSGASHCAHAPPRGMSAVLQV